MPASAPPPPQLSSSVRLVFESGKPAWLLIVAGCILLLAQLGHLRPAWQASSRRRLRLAAALLRIVGCGVLLWALCGPVLRLQRGEQEPRRIGVVIDNSHSMLQLHAGNEPRHTLAKKLAERLETQARDRDKKDGQTTRLRFFNLAGPCASPEACAVPQVGKSALLTALERAASEDGQSLAALVLLSDGQDTERSAEAMVSMPLSQQRRLGQLGSPVTTLTLTDPPGLYDWRVEDVVHDPFVFIKTTTQIDCVLGRDGAATSAHAAGQVVVQLVRNGQVVQQKALPAPRAGGRHHVGFSLRAEEVGEHIFACRIVPQAGELTAHNNQRAFVLRVLRDKVRVLHVVGRPSWDERFLRQELKANRNIDVISFFILRTPDDDISIPENELSLIPFPVARLFTSELRNFDVIILQNFDFRPYHMGQYLENLREAVRAGLGLVMVGGPESFADGGYMGTPLEEVLPLQLQAPATAGTGAVGPTTAYEPLLTRAGAYHPLLDFGGPTPRAQLLRQLPALRGITPLGAPLPGAQVLVEMLPAGQAPALGAEGSLTAAAAAAAQQGARQAATPLPLVAARDVGRGRTLAVASDGLWRWRFTEPGAEGAAKIYARLWHNAWRWLTHDPELRRLHLTSERAVVEAGGDGALLTGSVRALGRDWQPLPGAHVTVQLVPHPGAPLGTQASEGPAVPPAARAVPLHLALDDDGLASWRFVQVPAGVWRIEATLDAAGADASAPAEEAGESEESGQQRADTTIVVQPSAEQMRLLACPEWMASIAKAGGGAALSATSADLDLLAKIPEAKAPPMRVSHQEDVRAWQHGGWVALFVAAFSLAWALGRRLGSP